jgi:hypothetical protein
MQEAIFGDRNIKGKAIPVKGRGGLQGFELSRLPYFVEKQLTRGGVVVARQEF